MRKFILLAFWSELIWSQGFTIRTIAGTSTVGEGVAAPLAALASAEGIAIDGLGNVYIADAPDHRIRKIEPSGRISTVAGNGQPGSGGDGGPASTAQLNSPYGLAVDLLGNLYVADLGNARVRRISASGTITTLAGGGTTDVSFFGAPLRGTDAKLTAPRNLAVDAAGQVYISDFGAHRILRLSTDGQLTHLVGSTAAGSAGEVAPALTAPLKSPTALAFDRSGNLYIADSGNAALRRWTAGVLRRVTSPTGYDAAVQFATITGLAVDHNSGDLYVAEGRDSPVRRITSAGEGFVFAYGARDVAVDGAGAVWLADGPFVRKLSQLGSELVAGTGSFQFGGDGGPATAAKLRSPSGVATDQAGNIYVADTANHRVRRIGADGQIQTVAGNGEGGYSGDGGLAIAAALRSPMSVAVDTAGNLFIADTGNHAVRRVNAAGMIETWVGTGTAGSVGDNGAAKRAQLNQPQGIHVDTNGSVTIADTQNHRVVKVSGAGWLTVLAGRGTPGNTGDGALARTAAMQRPTDVDYDAQGELFIADSGNKRIRRVNAQGIMNGFPSAGLVEPVSLAWRGDGFYVADAGRHRVVLLSANGSQAEIAGTGQPGFAGDDGAATRALLNRPSGLAVNSNGDLLIADQENHRVRSIGRTLPLPITGGGGLTQSSLTAIVNSASLRESPLVPGGLATLFGTGLGLPAGSLGRTDVLGRWETSVEGVEVRFDGLAAPLFYVSDTQINLQVPRMVAGRARVTVTVTKNGSIRATGIAEVAESAPALFLGAGNQLAALNQDGGVNLAANPAARGSVVTFFATGSGLWDVDLPDGVPAIVPLPRPRLPVSLWIGGQVAELLYAGAAPGQVGLLQINARIPLGTLPGQVAVVLQVGGAASEVGPVISAY